MPLKEFLKSKLLFGDHKLFPRTPLREWIRKYLPGPREGYVEEDLDLIHLRYGKAINRDRNADGQFLLCEWKTFPRELPYSQRRVFGLIDKLLRQADPAGRYYQGFYLICWDGHTENIIVNHWSVSQERFQSFLMGEFVIPPLLFK